MRRRCLWIAPNLIINKTMIKIIDAMNVSTNRRERDVLPDPEVVSIKMLVFSPHYLLFDYTAYSVVIF